MANKKSVARRILWTLMMMMLNVTMCGRKHKLYEDLYRCQYNLAGIYQRTGNLSQALRHVDVSIKCAMKVKDKLSERESLILKGKVRIATTTTDDASITEHCY